MCVANELVLIIEGDSRRRHAVDVVDLGDDGSIDRLLRHEAQGEQRARGQWAPTAHPLRAQGVTHKEDALLLPLVRLVLLAALSPTQSQQTLLQSKWANIFFSLLGKGHSIEDLKLSFTNKQQQQQQLADFWSPHIDSLIAYLDCDILSESTLTKTFFHSTCELIKGIVWYSSGRLKREQQKRLTNFLLALKLHCESFTDIIEIEKTIDAIDCGHLA